MIGRQVFAAVRMLAVLTALTGVVYPLVVNGISQVAMPETANGSLLFVDGRAVGSLLIGQDFVEPGYFHSRPRPMKFGPRKVSAPRSDCRRTQSPPVAAGSIPTSLSTTPGSRPREWLVPAGFLWGRCWRSLTARLSAVTLASSGNQG